MTTVRSAQGPGRYVSPKDSGSHTTRHTLHRPYLVVLLIQERNLPGCQVVLLVLGHLFSHVILDSWCRHPYEPQDTYTFPRPPGSRTPTPLPPGIYYSMATQNFRSVNGHPMVYDSVIRPSKTRRHGRRDGIHL